MQARIFVLLFLPLAFAHPRQPSYQCFDFEVPLSFKATSLETSFPPFKNHFEPVRFLEQITARNPARFGSPIKGVNLDAQVDLTIAAQYCSPRKNARYVVQILTHGIGFDRTYWTFGGEESEYNYVYAATQAGYSTLSYDRQGNGQSTKSDPYNINQLQIETEVLKYLTKHLRNRDIPAFRHIPNPKAIVHVGHSYGSFISDALVAAYPDISDGIVLTGFSAANSSNGFPISSNFHLAKENQPQRFGRLSTGYLTWGDALSNQYSFLYWPFFSPDVIAKAEAAKWPFSIGELLTAHVTPAPQFTGPVLTIAGQYDRIFCEYDCTGLLEPVKGLFPASRSFEAYMQPNTGHGMNLHFNATGTYTVINDFIARNVKG